MKSSTYVIKALTIVSMIASLASCTSSFDQKLAEALGAWRGKHPDKLIEAWGAPTSTYITSDGRKVLSFEKETLATKSFYDYYRPQIYTSSSSCKINFFTDKTQSAITEISYIGDPYTCLELTLNSTQVDISK